MNRLKPHLTYANVMSTLCFFLLLGGGAYAAGQLDRNTVGPKQLRKNAVTTAKVKNEAITAAKVKDATLTGAQIALSTLGVVPAAQNAQTAQTSNTLAAAEAWHQVGTPGEPAFQGTWKASTGDGGPPAFYKDHEGIVHLKGVAIEGTSSTVFSLPPGYRPLAGKERSFAIVCGGLSCDSTGTSLGTASIFGDDGSVRVSGTSAFLDGVSFRAES